MISGAFSITQAAVHMTLSRPLPELVKSTEKGGELALEHRPKRTAVFLSSMDGIAPPTEEAFFALLARNARHVGQYFGLPPEQVVEIGTQVDL